MDVDVVMKKLEFRLKISPDELQMLRDNSYRLEENRDATDIEVLIDMFGFHQVLDGRFGESFELETLEIEKVEES